MAKSIKPMWAVYGPGGWIAPYDDFSDAEKEARDEARRNVGSNFVVFGAVASFVADPPVVRTVVLQRSDEPAPAPEPEDIIDYMAAKAAGSAAPSDDAAIQPAPGALTLREGRFYLRRDGTVVGPAAKASDGPAPWAVGGNRYAPNGRYNHSLTTTTDLIAECDPDGWVEWAGGECPVPADTRVEIKIFGGAHLPAGCFDWGSGKAAGCKEGDIISFRVVQS